MMFPESSAFKVPEGLSFLTAKLMIPRASNNSPVSLIHTKVGVEGTTPLLSSKMPGNSNAKAPTESAMKEAMVRKIGLLILFINSEPQSSAGNQQIHLIFVKKANRFIDECQAFTSVRFFLILLKCSGVMFR